MGSQRSRETTSGFTRRFVEFWPGLTVGGSPKRPVAQGPDTKPSRWDVDPQLIKRTRQWLIEQRQNDGSWDPDSHRLHNDPTLGQGDDDMRLSTTAYIAWSVFRDPSDNGPAESRSTLEYLRSHRPEGISSAYMLALMSNALLSIDPTGLEAAGYLARLDAIKQTSRNGNLIWWDQPPGGRTMFYGAGRSGNVETASTAAMAMIRAGRYTATVRGVLAWLITQRDSHGTWHSTQGTVLALKALVAGTGKTLGGNDKRHIEVVVDDKKLREFTIQSDEHDVVRQVDLSEQVAQGDHEITLTDRAGNAPGYQVVFRYHVPDEETANRESPLSIEIDYSKVRLQVDDTTIVEATVTNNTSKVAPMVIADLPISAGFRLESGELDRLVKAGAIAKYQVTARSVIVYVRGLAPKSPLKLQYRLRATMPVKIVTQSAWVYEYYDPDKKARTPPVKIAVIARG